MYKKNGGLSMETTKNYGKLMFTIRYCFKTDRFMDFIP